MSTAVPRRTAAMMGGMNRLFGAAARPRTAISPTVVIACKWPGGLMLQLPGKQRQLSGPQHKSPFAKTTVDREFWDSWLAANKDSPLVKDKIVFPINET